MKKRLALVLLLAFLLCGCVPSVVPTVPTTQASEPVTIPTESTTLSTEPSTIPTTIPAEPTTEPVITTAPTEPVITTAPTEPVVTTAPTEPVVTTAPTEPAHSAFYIPGLSVEDVILYFNEVCLDAEVNNSGDPSLIQKWTAPIYYAIYGAYNEEDLATAKGFAAWLNTVEGFPGIYEADSAHTANLVIHFCTPEDMVDLMGDWTYGLDGAVTFWYDFNEIHDGTICIRDDLYQSLRNSVILEEIYNGLGPVQDTGLRPDSIIFSEFSEPQALTAVDELILRLLYHPEILPGFNAEECEQVIRSIYY